MKLVRARGFEPRTLGLKDRYSDQLSYTRRIKTLSKVHDLPKCHNFLYNLENKTLVGADGNAPRALTSLPSGTDLQSAVGGNTQ